MADTMVANGKKFVFVKRGGGVTPTGKINITTTSEVDVTNYATAQVVDANLKAENIKEGVTILGITGTLKQNVVAQTATAAEMSSALTDANKGKITEYTGTTTDEYTNGDLYKVVEG